ncbi:MAG TPA: Gfo/Idh/MocA family oxidoreductase [Candidatus Paceibacterota bacterium]|nr:Gfo/Idh/MocA family oxidoreductase [Verrucomicrobiota bacterium]HSA11884.1 Gfo/Idh/MocA family oxidoreductase [Candidatus Paceibacterota bacterium]
MPVDFTYVRSDSSFSRRTFLKTLGAATLAAPFVMRDLIARPPSSVLRHASFGAAGMAWEDVRHLMQSKQVELVAVAEVDLRRTAELKKHFPTARVYQDWRELLDKEGKQLDSVNVSTPDHMHAPIAMSALQLGKHVYCQKPLTHDLYEARKLTEYARWKGVVTQMGIQIHSTSFYRMAALLVQAGAIGRVKEVHSWNSGTWGDTTSRPDKSDPVPTGLDWDLWQGVCAERPFIGDEYYHPNNWRKRLDFGTGTLGDMGCHIFDPVFTALELRAPLSVRSEGPPPNQWNWPIDSQVQYVFPGTRFTAANTIPVTWYDGTQKPPSTIRALLEGDDLPGTGSILVGTQGALVVPHVARPLLYPDKKFKDLKFPDVTEQNHWGRYVEACLGGAPTSAGFDYSGPLAEAVLLGTVALRFPQTTLHWNAAALSFAEGTANQFIRRIYRSGWGVTGLS